MALLTYEAVRQWGPKFGKAFSDRSASALPLAVTNGIWTRSLSRSRANNIGSGALSTRMASFSTS
ncbi:hypothetical protein BRDID11018_83540 [Bradyrhizobium diazoefficiens]